MKIEHIAMYINDLEKARSFFMQYLGARSNEGYHNPRTESTVARYQTPAFFKNSSTFSISVSFMH
jgi:catechol 2,3-dioxygenase-like lactoylglutathione lyase family enzyme